MYEVGNKATDKCTRRTASVFLITPVIITNTICIHGKYRQLKTKTKKPELFANVYSLNSGLEYK